MCMLLHADRGVCVCICVCVCVCVILRADRGVCAGGIWAGNSDHRGGEGCVCLLCVLDPSILIVSSHTHIPEPHTTKADFMNTCPLHHFLIPRVLHVTVSFYSGLICEGSGW